MCGVLVIPFAIVGLIFGILKERATKFVAWCNSFSEKEQDLYYRKFQHPKQSKSLRHGRKSRSRMLPKLMSIPSRAKTKL